MSYNYNRGSLHWVSVLRTSTAFTRKPLKLGPVERSVTRR